MNFPLKFERRPGKLEGSLVAGGLMLATLIAWFSPLGRWTEILSYDLISVCLSDPPPADTVLVYLDERSHVLLDQPYERPWDRRLHSRLLQRLHADAARLVYFDIVFEQASPDPAVNVEFAAAIRQHGNVVLGGSIANIQEAESIERRAIVPVAILREAGRAWGPQYFFRIDGDGGVRLVPPPLDETLKHAAWHAARLLRSEADGVSSPPTGTRWIHYFGPAGTFAAVSYAQALEPDGVPPGFFKNKVVLIGAKYSTGFSGSGKDSFATPYSRFGFGAMTGTEVNANLLSTLRADLALRKLSSPVEIALLLAGAATLGWVLLGLGPVSATLTALGVMIVASTATLASSAGAQVWGNWFLFACGVVPAALIISVERNYYIERSRRQKVTRAFEKYLSPEMVRQMSLSSVDLKPGGTTRRVTAMMTDIEGFSALSEKMSAEEVSRMLIAYFSQLTQHVFDHQGTVVQFVGDAIYCVWGAPLDQPEQADQALRSALAIQASMHGRVFERHPLKTRIGLSTGYGLCGNLGSAEHFAYAVIGDNTNLAARIESANKQLGTRILLSESAVLALGGAWVLREVGDFLVAGRKQSVRLWEPIAAGAIAAPEWAPTLHHFGRGLVAWREGNWPEAETCFRSALAHRGPNGDGPSEFYLEKLRESHGRNFPGPIAL